MGLYKKKNIVVGAALRLLLPEALWNRRFVIAWAVSFVTLLIFDILWCMQTSYRAFALAQTYVNLIFFSTFMAMPAVFSRKQWPMLLTLFAVDLVMIANLMYCNEHFAIIPINGYLKAGMLFSPGFNLLNYWRWEYIILFVVTLVAMMILPSDHREQQPSKPLYAISLGTMGILSVLFAIFHGGPVAHVNKMYESARYASAPPVVYSIIGTLGAELATSTESITPVQRRMIANWGKNHMHFQGIMQSPNAIADSLRRNNIVVIMADALESWAVGAKLEGKELTPHITKAMRDTASTYYINSVVPQTSRGRSIDAQLLMLAGMYPTRNELFTIHTGKGNDFQSLPLAMKEQGAKTYLLTGEKASTANGSLAAHALGIDHLEMADSWDDSEKIGSPARLSDASLIEQTIAKMQRGDVWPDGERAFVLIDTHSLHYPFEIPPQFRSINFKNEYAGHLNDYATAVHYTDQAIGRLIDYLKSRQDWNQTVVVIAGANEALRTNRHEMRNSVEGSKLVAAESYVPFIVLNSPFRGKHTSVVGQVDLYPTLLDIVGLPYRWRGMGFSALAAQSPHFAVDSYGGMHGSAAGAPQGLHEHVRNAPLVSDLMIRYNLLN